MCSRKTTATTCSAVRRGTICRWVDESGSELFDLLSLSDDVVAKRGKLEISPMDVILLIALVMTIFAISLQLCHWYWRWRGRRYMGYEEVQDNSHEGGQKALKGSFDVI